MRWHNETFQVINIYSDQHANIDKETGINGNFLELVKLLSFENQKFFSAYEALPKNAKYTGKIIKNDMLRAASILVAEYILKEVNEGSKVYSLIVDEARDDSKLEQMSICVRYVHCT